MNEIIQSKINWRCVSCKRVIPSVIEPDRCPDCHCRTLVQMDPEPAPKEDRSEFKQLAVLVVELLELATNGSSGWAARNRKQLGLRARVAIEGWPDAIAAGEANYRAWCASDPEHKAEGTKEGLATVAHMLEEYGAAALPANEHGQVDFARSMLDSAASEIRAYLANEVACGR